MNKFTFSILFVLSSTLSSLAQTGTNGTTKSQVPQTGKTNWSIDPFEHAVFVENKGQFDTVVNAGGKILFQAKIGAITAYFTATGVFYTHVETEQLDISHGDPDQDGNAPKKTYYNLTTTWKDASSNVTVEASDELSYYYTYPKGTHDTYFANVFKKITYHNLYPGIDVVYSFHEGSNNLEYSIVVNPGADLSKVQLKYKNTSGMHVDGAGNVLVSNNIGTLKESAPVSYYQDDHAPISVNAQANNPIESFIAHGADTTKTYIIDPVINWTTNPAFINTGGYDYAFDIDYDNLGNVYVYGGGEGTRANPSELVKLNSAGVIQWDYFAATLYSATDFYGDFAVDKHSLECYCVEGWNSGGGGRVEKISPLGALMATDPGNNELNEIWRIQSSICPQGFVMFGNGTCCPDHAAMLDTTMATMNPVNILGAACTTGYHDMALTAVDPFGGFAWTECTHSLVYTTWNNYLIKSPIPALAPSAYQTPIHYSFYEIGSITYDPNYTFNAMNGLAAGRLWLYSYNGDTLKQINKNTGAINAVVKISATPFKCGGVGVDLCDNIYVANNNTIQVYDAALALTSTLPVLPGTTYALAVGPYTGQLVYACGQNFVSSISLGPPLSVPIVITKTPSNCSACSGTATTSAMPCGVLDTLNVYYKWSDGETTRTASHLCSGVDTVKVTVECGLVYSDTITIPVSSGGILVTRDSTAATCTTPGIASINVTGGHPPYTYDWSNGSTTSSTGPVGAGRYCVGVKDNSGCSDSLCISVQGTPHPTISVSPSTDTICPGFSATLTANVSGGSPPYIYLWSSSSTTSTADVSPAATTTYTVTGTDANGCSSSTSVIVDVLTDPLVTITAPNDTICLGGAGVTLTASGAASYTWLPAGSNLSCYNCATPAATPTVTTTYTVIGANTHGCKDSTTFTVVALEPLTLIVTPDIGICPGKTVTLNALQTSGSVGTFVWSPGGSTAQSITVSPATSQTYTVTCTNSCGALSKDITVTVLPLPLVDFSAGPPGCAPLCMQFRNFSTISAGNIVQWEWTFGNGDTSDSKAPIYCYPKSGVYDVTLTALSDSGCSSTLKINNMVTVFSSPVANFSVSPQPTTILEPTIQFTDNSTDTYGIVYWGWNFGDNRGDSSFSALENPQHIYADTGTFCVKLGVENSHGCVDTSVDCIVIDPIFALYIPDAFSPNGNGRNDVFTAKGNDVKTFEMYIFDRWGMELFHCTDINNGWPGTVKGGTTICQEDTYVYLIKATDSRNILHSYTGSVTLIK